MVTSKLRDSSGRERRARTVATRHLTSIAATAALALMVLPALEVASATAATATTPPCQDSWTNLSGGSWSTAGNWSAGVPTNADATCVSIATSAPVTGSNVDVASLVVGAPAGASGSTVLSLNGTTTLSRSSSVLATGRLNLQNTLDQTAGDLAVSGLVTTSGNLAIKGSGSESVAGSGVFVVSPSTQALLEGPGTFVNAGAVIAGANSSLYVTPSPGTMTFDNAAGVLANEGGDVQVQSDATFVEGAGAVVGTYNSDTAAPPVRVLGGLLDLSASGEASFEVSNGTLEGTIGANQTVETLGTVTTSGPVVNHGTLLAANGGTVRIDPSSTLVNDGLVAVRAAQLNLFGTLSNSSGATISLASQLELEGPYDLTNAGTISIAPTGDVLATFTSGRAASIDNAAGTISDGVSGTGGFLVDQGATFTEGAGRTAGGPVQVEGTLHLAGSGASSFVVTSGTLDGDVATNQSVTIAGTTTAATSIHNDGTVVLRGATLNLTSAATLTNNGVLGLESGQSNVNGNLTNEPAGRFTIDDGTELTDSTAGSTIDNAGDLYLLNQDSIVMSPGVAFENTGDVHFGVIGGSWGSFGLHASIEARGTTPQTVELGGSFEPVFPQGNPPSSVTLPPAWTSGDGASILYAVAEAPSLSSAPFNEITCGASTPGDVSLSCSTHGGLSAISASVLEPGLVPTNVSLASSAPSISGPCGTPACPESTYGQPVALTATLAAEYGVTAPTGTVTFYDGSLPIGTASASSTSGVTTATLTSTGLEPGLHEFSALYGGDTTHFAGNSNQLEESVGVQTPSVTLHAPATTSAGASAVLVATVKPSASAPHTPTGAVAFFEGSDLLGIAPVATSGSLSTASLATTSLSVGSSDAVTAQYEGDVHFAAGTSSASTVSVSGAGVLRVLTLGIGAGTVAGRGVSCPTTCVAIEPHGADIALTATPSSGSSLRAWGGACSGTGSCDPAVAATTTVLATFVPSSAHLKAALATAIRPVGAAAKLGAVSRAKGYVYKSFAVLESGTATVSWTHTQGHKTTVVATGATTFTTARSARLKVTLTASGTKLLAKLASLKLAVVGTFTPTASRPVRTTVALTLHR